MQRFKAIICVIVGGVATLAAAVFIGLQWGSHSRFSAFGPEMTTRTIYLVLGAAVGGAVVFWLARLMLRGLVFLGRERRREKRIASKLQRDEKRT